MRDPMTWAVPLFRVSGILVKVHLFFFLITIPLCLRQISKFGDFIAWWDIVLLTVVVLFGVILLHEFGHCIGARRVGGDASEVLLWPLGGLAYVDVPHHWKANLITVVAGPATNLVICFCCAVALLGGGFLPGLNPLSNPYEAAMHNVQDGRTYTSVYGMPNVYRSNTAERVPVIVKFGKDANVAAENDDLGKSGLQWAVAPTWAVWVWRTFWMSWLLFLFNLIPAFPMDGGRIFRDLWWRRTGDYTQSTSLACYVGYGSAAVMFMVCVYREDVMLAGLVFMIVATCWQTLFHLQNSGEAGPFGYDFSQGYTSLERDDPDAPPAPPRPGFVRRWLNARQAKRIRKETEARAQDELRMEDLLEKIARMGKGSLTDEELRFMQQMSARYRNRS